MAADNAYVPIEAKLVHSLQAGHIKIGDSVLAKVEVKWQSPECTLREGAILRGHVVAEMVRSRAAKTSEVAVLFDGAECNGSDMRVLPMTLAALIVRDPTSDANAYEPMAMSAALSGIQNRAMDRKFPGHSSITPSQIRATRISEPQHRNSPRTVKPGDVVGLNGVRLRVGGGPEGSSVISSDRHNLNLAAATQIVLVVSRKPGFSGGDQPTSVIPPKIQDSEPTIDETEICAPPSCSIALDAVENDRDARASLKIPTRNLGYPLPPTSEMIHFDYEAAIAYLGPQQLLFTFNPHILVPRPGLESAARTLRIIRGALLDLPTMKAKKVMEWRVPDSGQYLWPIGKRGVLIHAGRELRLYGPGMKLERSLALNGALAFVRSSPSGSFIAIGVIHERHSEQTHRELKEAESREPEEDLSLQVVDASFKTVMEVTRSSRSQPPVLLEDGEVQTRNIRGTRWRVVETTWEGEERIVARVTSACRPQTDSLSPNLLFVVGCNLEEYGRWYRAFGKDGKTLLKGHTSSYELEPAATSSVASPIFAVLFSRVSKPRMATDVFRAAELKSQDVSVHSTLNGKRLVAVSNMSPVPTMQTVALSPDGTQLAVLAADQIAVYAIAATPGQ